MAKKGVFQGALLREALKETFLSLAPQIQILNPVMFVTYLGAITTTILTFWTPSAFNIQVSIWLWLTVLFANFSSAIAKSRGKAQAASLRKSQKETLARKVVDGKEERVSALELKRGDCVICQSGEMIPADGDVIEGIATVDESAITGESAPVIRESAGDRSAVTAGTRVVSDCIVIRVTSEPGQSFLDRMIHLVEGAKRQKTPNEIALNIVLVSLTILFLLAVISVKSFSLYSSQAVTIPVLIALLVCLIPTTISALLNAIGIAGMDRLIQRNVIATSGRAIEAAGDIDLLLLDKTGTITLGNRMATEFLPVPGVSERDLAIAAQLASLSDETPEGRSIVVLAKNRFNLRAESLRPKEVRLIPFSAKSRMSGVDYLDANEQPIRTLRKGAIDAIRHHVESLGGEFPQELALAVEGVSTTGGTPLLVADGANVLGIVHLKDVIKGGLREQFLEMRKVGIRTVMVTGDNPLTAQAIAAEAGVDDFIAEATPEMKLACIRDEQKKGHLVAMTGDGTNDAPALAQADVGVAMNTGTQASREAGNMIDLDSSPTKLLDVVKIGKQLLMTRGALTTFSMTNDVAKYFAIIPAIFGGLYALAGENGPLEVLNVMRLFSPESAVLSALIFNALVIVLLIPLALKGVAYQPMAAAAVLRRNLLIYGLGGLVAPFIGIKLIDLLLVILGLA
jgi:potassium-transporting ATPase ATP-binding subunit